MTISPEITLSTEAPRERAALVGIEVKRERNPWRVEESLAELAQLASTAEMDVVGHIHQKVERIHPATLMGKGKLEELLELIDGHEADAVIFDDELSPRQQREIEERLEERFDEQWQERPVKVLDRTTLILDIFAQHAHTREGALQVELAQYQYRLPRLTRAWTHLVRQAGGAAGRGGTGGVGLRGPGETQLEIDRRDINRRIDYLKRELENVRTHRALHRQQRRKSGVPVVSLVGYTNAGKSTLLNTLSGANVLTADMLFATLDPTTRRVELPNRTTALFTDTVGFIQKLPTTLVAAFRATLEEITEADMILHVVDITHPHVMNQVLTVEETLAELDATGKPVITALNKIDRLENLADVRNQLQEFPNSAAVSALTGQGISDLLACVEQVFLANMVSIDAIIPYSRGDLVALIYEKGTVESEDHVTEGTRIKGWIPPEIAVKLE
jgi:GTP-binding protein HflX